GSRGGRRLVGDRLAGGGPPVELGRVVLRLPTESVRHACWQLLRLGAGIEVLEPPELRERMAATVADLAALYGTGPG
ncbi:WYL domain-containing protein, partial [Streptosporangium sp. NPDC048865]|uniref:WYL domain-containing protein n=1 Tax=Streptosporangium sp. NPDC048865 TaxID=3155766 RepID=UPI003436AD31